MDISIPNLQSTGLRYQSGKLEVLDQRRLPHEELWLTVHDPDDMVELIQQLAVRGAPLIGVAAAMSLATYALTDPGPEALRAAGRKLHDARPTAVNLMRAMQAMMETDLEIDSLVSIALHLFREDVEMCEGMATAGSPVINDGDGVLTVCNTGGLATVGSGTAFAVIKRAHDEGKRIHVYATETRPLLQGGRLTTWELSKNGIPYTLICDNMAAALMRTGKVQVVLTGADRISRAGDYANKIGTYSLAVLAKYHQIPFYPVAPFSTVDANCPDGDAIPIEERSPHEVHGHKDVRWAPSTAAAWNPAFDVTPASLISGLILDRGLYTVSAFQKLFKKESEHVGDHRRLGL